MICVCPKVSTKCLISLRCLIQRAHSGEWTGYGGLAQLGERLPCKQEVSGSIPLISTTSNHRNGAKEMGQQLSWLEHTTDNREVGGSSPLWPTIHQVRGNSEKVRSKPHEIDRSLNEELGKIFESFFERMKLRCTLKTEHGNNMMQIMRRQQ